MQNGGLNGRGGQISIWSFTVSYAFARKALSVDFYLNFGKIFDITVVPNSVFVTLVAKELILH